MDLPRIPTKQFDGVLIAASPESLRHLSIKSSPINIFEASELLPPGSKYKRDDEGRPRRYCLHLLTVEFEGGDALPIDGLVVRANLEEYPNPTIPPAFFISAAPTAKVKRGPEESHYCLNDELQIVPSLGQPPSYRKSDFTLQGDMNVVAETRIGQTGLGWTLKRKKGRVAPLRESFAYVTSASRGTVCYVNLEIEATARDGRAVHVFTLSRPFRYPVNGQLPSPKRPTTTTKVKIKTPRTLAKAEKPPTLEDRPGRVKFSIRDSAPSEGETPDERKAKEITVWYATSRRPCPNPKIGNLYTGSHSDELHYGFCRVFIPKYHTIGSLGSNFIKRLLTGKDDRLKIEAYQFLEEKSFWRNIGTQLKSLTIDNRTALVFIHGYNTNFNEAVLRTAQISCDLAFPGATFLYSWPSRGIPLAYSADRETVEAHSWFLEAFLLNLAAREDVERVHVIAHSLGNRGLLHAVDRISRKVSKRMRKPFGQLILAAVDVDHRTFKQYAEAYRIVADRTTMYASSMDMALWGSSFLQGFKRVGYAPPVTVVSGVDTIKVPGFDLIHLGHTYFAEFRPVIQDMSSVILEAKPAKKRFGLEAVPRRGGDYWIMKP